MSARPFFARPGRHRLPCQSLLPLLLLFASGCVSRSAGYQDVRHLVADRTAAEVRWHHVAGKPPSDKVQKLLDAPPDADRAMRIALLNHPRVQATFEDLGVARADWVRAVRLPNPEADASLRYGPDHPQLELEVTEDITDFIFLPLRSGAAAAALDVAKLRVTGQLLDIAFEAREAFVAFQASAQLLELRRTVLEATYASYQAAQALHDAGNLNDLDLANQQAFYQEARLAFAQAQVQLATARQELAAALGLPALPLRWTEAPQLGEPREESLGPQRAQAKAFERSLDLAIARQSYAAATRQANLAEIEGWTPELRAGVAAEREDDRWAVGPALGVTLPLFYQGQGEVARFEAEMRRSQADHRAVQVQLNAAVKNAVVRLELAEDRAKYYRDVLLPLRARVLEQTQLNYNAMAVGIFQLLQAKRDQIQTAQEYVQALRDYWLARTRYDKLMAGRLTANAAELGALPIDRPVTSQATAAPDAH